MLLYQTYFNCLLRINFRTYYLYLFCSIIENSVHDMYNKFSSLIEISCRFLYLLCSLSLSLSLLTLYETFNTDFVFDHMTTIICKSYIRDFDFLQRSIDSRMNRSDYLSRWIMLSHAACACLVVIFWKFLWTIYCGCYRRLRTN